MLGRIRHVHMVGIGGIGMSSIARVLLARGYQVTGSDLQKSEVTQGLEEAGAVVFEGHSSTQVGDADVVVYSSAVPSDTNPETCEAVARRIPLIPRAEMLGELMGMKFGIGIAGTHGKTTTTSMVGLMATEAGFDPTIIVGGKVSVMGSNAVAGEGDIIVIEADEYDRTFLRLNPALAVITCIEPEHMDTYHDVADLHAAFTEFANGVPFFGAAIVCLDDRGVQQIVAGIERRLITYGTVRQAMVRAVDIRRDRGKTRFGVLYQGERLGDVTISAIGIHNVRNALGAITVGLDLDVPFEKIQVGLKGFLGVNRRFQILGEERGICVIDDYAHHPTEIEATLTAASEGYPNHRIVAVFQPHLFSRTEYFKIEFARAFLNADVVVMTDIYAARETQGTSISGEDLADLTRSYGHREVYYEHHLSQLPEFMEGFCRAGDVVLFLGAGSIWRAARKFMGLLAS